MIAGIVLISAVAGALAVALSFALALPTWMVVLSYPLACTVTLLLTAALLRNRNVAEGAMNSAIRSQA